LKILVTGANGQLGSELCKTAPSTFEEIGEFCEVLGVDLPDCDITQLQIFRDIAESFEPDVIINCAAYTNVDKCETDRDTAFAVNALGARNAAIIAEELGAKLIHISTDYVFNGIGTSPKAEFEVCEPQSVYGLTKLAGENFVKDFSKKYFIVRTAWLYGYIGGNFVKTILNAGEKNGTLKVVNDQIGNPTNVVDLAKHLLKLAQTEEYGTYHCTNNGECSWFDFASEFIRLSGIDCVVTPCTTDEFPRPAKRPAYSSLDNAMLRLTVGDEMRSWQEAIQDYMTHYNAGEVN
jgi:dTDP-4-dehydrorhamnose reductase